MKLTDQDFAFAEDIATRFKISIGHLTFLIYFLRVWEQAVSRNRKLLPPGESEFPSWKWGKYEEFTRILESEVTTIHLETPEGTNHLSQQDPLYHCFNGPLKWMKQRFHKEMRASDKQWNKYINEWPRVHIWRHFTYYFRNSSLSMTDQTHVIGLFHIHFETKSLKTEDQWVNNMGSTDSYPDYLSGILHNEYNRYRKKLLL